MDQSELGPSSVSSPVSSSSSPLGLAKKGDPTPLTPPIITMGSSIPRHSQNVVVWGLIFGPMEFLLCLLAGCPVGSYGGTVCTKFSGICKLSSKRPLTVSISSAVGVNTQRSVPPGPGMYWLVALTLVKWFVSERTASHSGSKLSSIGCSLLCGTSMTCN